MLEHLFLQSLVLLREILHLGLLTLQAQFAPQKDKLFFGLLVHQQLFFQETHFRSQFFQSVVYTHHFFVHLHATGLALYPILLIMVNHVIPFYLIYIFIIYPYFQTIFKQIYFNTYILQLKLEILIIIPQFEEAILKNTCAFDRLSFKQRKVDFTINKEGLFNKIRKLNSLVNFK